MKVPRNITLRMAQQSLETKRRLDQQRIGVPVRPMESLPELPDDPTDLTDSQLMSLFVQTTRWSEFLGTQLAVAEVDESSAEDYLARVKAIKALANTGEKTVTMAKAKAYEDEDFLAASEAYQEAYSYRKMIKVIYDNTERRSTLLSRELTRRVNRNAREGRVEAFAP